MWRIFYDSQSKLILTMPTVRWPIIRAWSLHSRETAGYWNTIKNGFTQSSLGDVCTQTTHGGHPGGRFWQRILIALFTVTVSHLHYNVFERGCEAISGKECKIARNCLTSTLKNIVMQMRNGNAWFNSTCYHAPPGHTPGDL